MNLDYALGGCFGVVVVANHNIVSDNGDFTFSAWQKELLWVLRVRDGCNAVWNGRQSSLA